jgi:GAF domain-containing protein
MAEDGGERLHEPGRLAGLARSGLMDSAPEEDFDRLTRLASRVIGAPVALVSLVDDHRQFFKSQTGLAEPWASRRETPLTHSFCQHVVTSDAPLVVTDAPADPLVRDNLAIPDLGVQAYAGFPIRLDDGTVLGSFCVIDSSPRQWTTEELEVIEDLSKSVVAEIELRMKVTEAQRAQRTQKFLAEATRRLSESLDETEIVNRLVRLATSEAADLADWCSVAVVRDAATIERAAVAHRDPAFQDLANQLARRFPYDPKSSRVVPRVLATGKIEIIDPVTPEILGHEAPDPDQRRIVERLGAARVVVAPLRSPEGPLGSVTFARGGDISFTQDDVELAHDLATARVFAASRVVAETMQRTLLPPELPSVPGVEVDAFYRGPGTATMGGDFYDVFAARGKAWVATIGDVQGKGPEAASLIAQAKFTIRAGTMDSTRPARVLKRVNEVLSRADHDRFLTLALAVVQPAPYGLRVRLSLGGHPQPVKIDRDGKTELVGRPGTLIGAFPDVKLAEDEIELRSGEALVLYTDGVTESRRGDDFFGSDRLCQVLADAAERDAPGIVAAVSDAVGEFQDEARDDMAVLVIRAR